MSRHKRLRSFEPRTIRRFAPSGRAYELWLRLRLRKFRAVIRGMPEAITRARINRRITRRGLDYRKWHSCR